MKKAVLLFTIVLAVSCSSTKNSNAKRPLYEVLTQKSTGGAQVRFFEIISKPEEFTMIKNDPDLKSKIKSDDINTANFLILSAGEKTSGGYAIGIETVEETDKNIVVTVKETAPGPEAMVTMGFTTPYCVVRINSKKEIIIK